MLGAIIGDIVGSPYEFNNIKTTEFPLFSKKSYYTDDTVLTIAICDAIIKNIPYKDSLLWWGRRYPCPYGDYGGQFRQWLNDDNPQPYNSWGNGSAMRASSIGWLFDSLDDVLIQAKASAGVTHNHPEGIKGAQATASAVWMAKNGISKNEIKSYTETAFGYDLTRTTNQIRPGYTFDGSCRGTVPEAILCFLESTDFESAIRLAVSIGGDSDTIACITGGIAEAFYRHIDKKALRFMEENLPIDMKLVIDEFLLRTKLKKEYRTSFFSIKAWIRKISNK